jgi:hypothetical protein
VLKRYCALWKNKIKNEKVLDDLYLATANVIEYLLLEKDYNFAEKINSDEKQGLIRFFYITYERITKKQNCLTLKPAKVYNIHYSIITSEKGVGLLHRSLFQTQK